MDEIGCKPKVSMVNKLMMRARMSMGAMSCITPNPVVRTNGAPRLIQNMAAMESGSHVDCDKRRKKVPIQAAAAVMIKPILLAA